MITKFDKIYWSFGFGVFNFLYTYKVGIFMGFLNASITIIIALTIVKIIHIFFKPNERPVRL
jgi:hypothetical protein